MIWRAAAASWSRAWRDRATQEWVGCNEFCGRRLLLHNAKTNRLRYGWEVLRQSFLSALPRHVDLETAFNKGNEPLTKQRPGTAGYAARKAVGLRHVRLHDLRHSFSSLAAMQSGGLPMIGKLLGVLPNSWHGPLRPHRRQLVLESAERVGQLTEWSRGARSCALPVTKMGVQIRKWREACDSLPFRIGNDRVTF